MVVPALPGITAWMIHPENKNIKNTITIRYDDRIPQKSISHKAQMLISYPSDPDNLRSAPSVLSDGNIRKACSADATRLRTVFQKHGVYRQFSMVQPLYIEEEHT